MVDEKKILVLESEMSRPWTFGVGIVTNSKFHCYLCNLNGLSISKVGTSILKKKGPFGFSDPQIKILTRAIFLISKET